MVEMTQRALDRGHGPNAKNRFLLLLQSLTTLVQSGLLSQFVCMSGTCVLWSPGDKIQDSGSPFFGRSPLLSFFFLEKRASTFATATINKRGMMEEGKGPHHTFFFARVKVSQKRIPCTLRDRRAHSHTRMHWGFAPFSRERVTLSG